MNKTPKTQLKAFYRWRQKKINEGWIRYEVFAPPFIVQKLKKYLAKITSHNSEE